VQEEDGAASPEPEAGAAESKRQQLAALRAEANEAAAQLQRDMQAAGLAGADVDVARLAAGRAAAAGAGAEGERRIAPDGEQYSRAEFIEFYGGTAEWDAAATAGAGADQEGDAAEVGEPLSVPGPDYPGGGWVQQEDARGGSYYYNLRTGARQTERPDEDQIDRS